MTYSASVVLENTILEWPHLIFAFLQLSPLWRGLGLLLEQFRIPFTQGWFMQSLIEIGLLVLEIFLKSFSLFLRFCYYLHLDKDVPLHLDILESCPQRMIRTTSGQNWPSGSSEVENVKVYRQRDDGQQAIRKTHLSFQLRWAKEGERASLLQLLEAMLWFNLHLNYLRKLSSKSELFWPGGFWGKKNKLPLPLFLHFGHLSEQTWFPFTKGLIEWIFTVVRPT
jgi:hypothetical protein